MEEKKIRQVDLCNKTGINKGLMNSYINGVCKPKHEKLKKLSEALDVSEAWLMGYDIEDAIRKETNNTILELLNNYLKLSTNQQEIILELIKNMNN